MKQVLLIALSAIFMAACSKTAAPGTNVFTTTIARDTFSLIDNGITFSDSDNDMPYECYILKTDSCSYFNLRLFQNSPWPIQVVLQNVPGPLNGTGIYKQGYIDNQGMYNFAESFNNEDIPNIIDSAMIDVTYANVDTLKGNITFWLMSALTGEYKTVTAVFKFYNAGN